jgi:parvulin-like peptidyl-prolyl isomerase
MPASAARGASLVVVITALFSALPIGAQDSDDPKAYPAGPPGALAQVGEQLITASEVDKLHESSGGELPRAVALDALILDAVSRHQLAREGIAVAGSKVDATVERALKDGNVNVLAQLKAKGITRENLRRTIELRLLMEQRLAPELTDEALERYFEEHRVRYLRQVRLARFLVLTRDNKTKALARARAIRERLAGDEDWTEVCRAESDDPLAPFDAGDLGWITEDERSFDPVLDSGRKLALGALSKQPIFSKNGYHIVKVTAERVPDLALTSYHGEARVRFDFARATEGRIKKSWLNSTRVVRFAGASAPTALYPR